MTLAIDTHGRQLNDGYTILMDPTFENRLKNFDPNLILVFDQIRKRWVVMEKALDGSGHNILIVAEDDHGNPKPLGEWVFNALFVYRARHEEKHRMGADQWIAQLKHQAEYENAKSAVKASQTAKEMIVDDINVWRRGIAELNNEPTSDIGVHYMPLKRFEG